MTRMSRRKIAAVVSDFDGTLVTDQTDQAHESCGGGAQQTADFVTASYNDEGFAKAMERFILHHLAESGSEA